MIDSGTQIATAPSAVLIAGPTASGKSSLALRLAQIVDGVIINADSMQIYDQLSILSARPTPEEMGDVEHRLYGYVDPAERYSVGRWLDDAVAAIKDVRAGGQCPILVGGTGLYFKALLEGLNVVPDVPESIRNFWESELDRLQSPEALHAILAERDPEMAATLKPADGQRILRALEILEATGKSLLEWQRNPGAAPRSNHCAKCHQAGALPAARSGLQENRGPFRSDGQAWRYQRGCDYGEPRA